MEANPRRSEELVPGTLVGEYRIDGRVAHGGMGTVYSATHPVIGKKAAIKVLNRAHCRRIELVQRFIDEARAVNQIRHENIVDIFAFGALPDGRSYFVMEWLEGESLEERLAREPLSIDETVDILEALCDALDAAHSHGVVHRDLKPANVHLVSGRRDGVQIKLLDFGIAKLAEQRSDRGNQDESTFMGTPAYMSPEQVGEEDVGPPSDVFSLGVMAYEIFVGRLPYPETETVERAIFDRISLNPEPPSHYWPEIPPGLEGMLLQMLAAKAEQRPPLAAVRSTLAELRAAALLFDAGMPRGGHSARPHVVRVYSDIRSLLRDLLSDLSSGLGWIEAEGTAPSAGTPVIVRFEVERLKSYVDFGGVLIRKIAAAKTKVLVRYDRLPKARLDHIFALASLPTQGQNPASGHDRGTATWRAFSGQATERFWVETRGRRRAGTDPKAQSARPRVTQVVPKPVSGLVREAVDTVEGVLVAPDTAEVATTDIKAARRAPWSRSLGAKVLGLMTFMTIACVVVMATVTLSRAQRDREFYLMDLNARTAGLLAAALAEKVGDWSTELRAAAAASSPDELNHRQFESLIRCNARDCEVFWGTPVEAALLKKLRSAIRQSDLVLVPADGGLVAAWRRSKKAFVAGVVPATRVVELTKPTPGLTVVMLNAEGDVLSAQGPLADSAVPQHQLIADFAARQNTPTLAKQYVAPNGMPVFGAWARVSGLGVAVLLPASVASEAVTVLRRQVGIATVAVLLIAVLISWLFARRMTARLRRLALHAKSVADGDFTQLAAVGGSDEVAHLAGSFNAMTTALRSRDAQVVRIQREMSEDESRSLQRQLGQLLEKELAEALGQMRDVIAPPVHAKDPLRDFRGRRARLRTLNDRAIAALEHTLTFAAIASRRVDFAETVAEIVDLTRKKYGTDGPRLQLVTANAVLFPRLEARESELREIVQTIVEHAAESTPPGRLVEVSLRRDASDLSLSVAYPSAPGAKKRASETLGSIQPLLVGHCGAAVIREHPDAIMIVLRLPTTLDEEPAS